MQSDDSYKLTRCDNTSSPVLRFPKMTKPIIVEFVLMFESPPHPIYISGERKSEISSDAPLRRHKMPCSGATHETWGGQ